MAMKVLLLLCEEDFFTDVKVEVKSAVVSGVHVTLFSKGMVRLLIDRLADAYDEVARMAYKLLEMIHSPEMIPWDTLYAKGKELCLSGRVDKSEGGAKVLVLCDQFKEVNGLAKIWDEVWESILNDITGGNLRTVAIEKPVHGRLVALRYFPLEKKKN